MKRKCAACIDHMTYRRTSLHPVKISGFLQKLNTLSRMSPGSFRESPAPSAERVSRVSAHGSDSLRYDVSDQIRWRPFRATAADVKEQLVHPILSSLPKPISKRKRANALRANTSRFLSAFNTIGTCLPAFPLFSHTTKRKSAVTIKVAHHRISPHPRN